MKNEKLISDIKLAIEEAKTEIQTLTVDEKGDLIGGWDNRGLDCISQRWYAPDSMRDTSSLHDLGTIIMMIENMLRKELR